MLSLIHFASEFARLSYVLQCSWGAREEILSVVNCINGEEEEAEEVLIGVQCKLLSARPLVLSLSFFILAIIRDV